MKVKNELKVPLKTKVQCDECGAEADIEVEVVCKTDRKLRKLRVEVRLWRVREIDNIRITSADGVTRAGPGQAKYDIGGGGGGGEAK